MSGWMVGGISARTTVRESTHRAMCTWLTTFCSFLSTLRFFSFPDLLGLDGSSFDDEVEVEVGVAPCGNGVEV